MPRGLHRKIEKNSLQKDLFSKVMNTLNETKRIESATTQNIEKAFTESDALKGRIFEVSEPLTDTLSEIYGDVHSTFRIPHSYNRRITMYGPPVEFDKKRSYQLPASPPNTIYRIVLVSGTHELFEWNLLTSLTGAQNIFVPQGSAVKFTQGFSDYTYNNKSTYDKNFHPGKGIKYPEKRHLIIFDFILDDPEEIKRVQAESITKATSSLTKTGGIISDLFKSIGSKFS
jgi:hypothetical protein